MDQDISEPAEKDREHIAAIEQTAAAAAEIAGVLAEAIGPAGSRIVSHAEFPTGDGRQILHNLSASHPAARAIRDLGIIQGERMGDGVKTTVLLAAALIEAGAEQIRDGIPSCRLAAGIRDAADAVIDEIKAEARDVEGLDDPVLADVALCAACGDRRIAEFVVEITRKMHPERVVDDEVFHIADHIQARWRSEDRVIDGFFVEGTRASRQMPEFVEDSEMLLIDDDLDVEPLPEAMLESQSGIARYWEMRNEFIENLRKLEQMGINCILVTGEISGISVQRLAEAGIFAVDRICPDDLWRIAQFSGAMPIPRRGIQKSQGELRTLVSRHDRISAMLPLDGFTIEIGSGEPTGTLLLGGSTPEIAQQRRQLAARCAASVQAAIRDGVCTGGGLAELAAVSRIESLNELEPTEHAGLVCMARALHEPAVAILRNAGGAAEAVVEAATEPTGAAATPIDCYTESPDPDRKIVDAVSVRIAAIRGAADLAEQFLRTGRLYA